MAHGNAASRNTRRPSPKGRIPRGRGGELDGDSGVLPARRARMSATGIGFVVDPS